MGPSVGQGDPESTAELAFPIDRAENCAPTRGEHM